MNKDTIIGYCGKGRYATDKGGKVELMEIKWGEFKDLVDDPQNDADKLSAWWIIFNDAKSRLIKNVTDDTKYYCLWADIDKNCNVEELGGTIRLWTGGCDFEIYSSHSATEICKKFRVVIPLKVGICVHDWISCQLLLNEAIEEAEIKPDNVNKNPVQLCFLPNRGEYYDVMSSRLEMFFDIEVLRHLINGNKSEKNDKNDNENYNFGCSGLTHKEIVKKLCIGANGYHEAQNYYAWGRIKEGATKGAVIGELECFAEMWKDDSNRWIDRFNDITRCVDGAIFRLRKESEIDWKNVKIDNIIGDLKFPLPPGLLGQFYQELYEMQIYQHIEFSHATAIGLIAGVCGRRFNINKLGLNVYLMILADTASGKDFIGKTIRRILYTCSEMGHGLSFVGSQRFTAGKALADSLYENRSQVCVFTEAGMLSQSRSGDPAALTKMLLDFYSKSGINEYTGGEGYSDKEKSIRPMRAPALTVISESTPSTILSELHSGNNLDNGLLPRQSLYRIESKKPYPNFNTRDYVSEEVLARIRRLVDECARFQKDLIRPVVNNVEWFDLESDMREFWLKCTNIENDEHESPKGVMASRMLVKAMKYGALATVFNAEKLPLDDNACPIAMGLSEWCWAKNIVLYELDNTLKFFGGSSFINVLDDLVKDIVAPCMFRMITERNVGKSKNSILTDEEQSGGRIPFTKLAQRLRNTKSLKYNVVISDPVEGLERTLEYMNTLDYLEIVRYDGEKRHYVGKKRSFNARDILVIKQTLIDAMNQST